MCLLDFRFLPKMTFWLLGFCQRRNFRAFLFLQKKALWAFRFPQKKELWAYWFMLLRGFRFLPKKELLSFPVAATEGSAALRFSAKDDFLAFGFLPKKELWGFSVSSKKGTCGLLGFPVSAKERTRELSNRRKRETCWLSCFYQRRNCWAFLVQSAGQPVVTRQCSPAPRPEKNSYLKFLVPD